MGIGGSGGSHSYKHASAGGEAYGGLVGPRIWRFARVAFSRTGLAAQSTGPCVGARYSSRDRGLMCLRIFRSKAFVFLASVFSGVDDLSVKYDPQGVEFAFAETNASLNSDGRFPSYLRRTSRCISSTCLRQVCLMCVCIFVYWHFAESVTRG